MAKPLNSDLDQRARFSINSHGLTGYGILQTSPQKTMKVIEQLIETFIEIEYITRIPNALNTAHTEQGPCW